MPRTINEKKELLLKAVQSLKKEFIGIDGIIDEIADTMLPWWLFPEFQLRPIIINLWGMTGSGKTALVQRLMELLQYSNYLMRFDMGEFGNSGSFLKFTLTRQLNTFHESSPVILLDEFQFAKTIDEKGIEVNNNALRAIWDLLDSGQIIYENDVNSYYISRAKRCLSLIQSLQRRNIQLKNGCLTSEAKEIWDLFTISYRLGYEVGEIDRSNPEKPPFQYEEVFLTDIFCTGLYEIANETYNSWQAVQEEIKKMNSLQELINFIDTIIEEEMAFKKMDLSKSLIFVVGNLDEAFAISGSINPDIDADEYRRYTTKINIADIKTALKSRFRNEQIARLGNNHLIYHSFSNKNFQDLIRLLLNKVIVQVKSKFGYKIQFTKAVEEIIYAEGVFPTQGVRPVMSTVRNLIESNLAKMILHINEQKSKTDSILWDYDGKQFDIQFFQGKKKHSHLKLSFIQKINSLRTSTKNDIQSLVAVHESGHCLVSMACIRIIPEYVISRTVDSESQGFCYTILPDEISTKKLLIDRIKLLLGGYVAEQMIFGKENNTTGVADDLQKATMFAHSIIRDYGMNDEPYKMNIHDYGGISHQFTFTEEHENAARKIVMDALAEVRTTLTEFKPFMLQIANYLSDHSRINKSELLTLAKAYHKKNKKFPSVFLDSVSYYDFRKKLKKAK